MSEEVVTSDRRCGRCGAPVESRSTEPADEIMGRSGERVAVSAWTILQPCGHAFKRSIGSAT